MNQSDFSEFYAHLADLYPQWQPTKLDGAKWREAMKSIPLSKAWEAADAIENESRKDYRRPNTPSLKALLQRCNVGRAKTKNENDWEAFWLGFPPHEIHEVVEHEMTGVRLEILDTAAIRMRQSMAMIDICRLRLRREDYGDKSRGEWESLIGTAQDQITRVKAVRSESYERAWGSYRASKYAPRSE